MGKSLGPFVAKLGKYPRIGMGVESLSYGACPAFDPKVLDRFPTMTNKKSKPNWKSSILPFAIATCNSANTIVW
jgi:hypothetical protein